MYVVGTSNICTCYNRVSTFGREGKEPGTSFDCLPCNIVVYLYVAAQKNPSEVPVDGKRKVFFPLKSSLVTCLTWLAAFNRSRQHLYKYVLVQASNVMYCRRTGLSEYICT